MPATCRFSRAIVRQPARSVVHGLRAHDQAGPTYQGIEAEHRAYVAALSAAGVEVSVLPALEEFPDSIFVEDPALVFPEGAILLRPGAPTRAGETNALAPTLRAKFDVVIELPSPGFADGGDILVTPAKVLIGLSGRTDIAGAEALADCLAQLGRESEIVETPAGILHFKTACSLLDDETVATTAQLAASGIFHGFRQITVPDDEAPAANLLRVNDVVLVGLEFPKTIKLLEREGYAVVPTATSEIGRIDAGLSCMSLRWLDSPASAEVQRQGPVAQA